MDLIDRQAAIDIVRHECGEWKGLAKEIVKQFNGLPSAQPEPITVNIDHELTQEEYVKLRKDMASAPIVLLPSAQPERDTPKRVLWTGWEGCRYTRYNCPNCKKPVRNDDVYCHRCGQKLMFPKVSHTPYVKGQKQEVIVRWDDE